jgi:hypothetical protein
MPASAVEPTHNLSRPSFDCVVCTERQVSRLESLLRLAIGPRDEHESACMRPLWQLWSAGCRAVQVTGHARGIRPAGAMRQVPVCKFPEPNGLNGIVAF